MRALRAFLFNVLFFAGTTALCICMVPLMPFGRKANQLVGHMWCHLTQGALAISVGMYKRIRGLENLPKGPCILVAKHQSAWETLTFHTVVPDPAYILKKELTRIPLMGQFLLFSGQIAVDRSAGSSALKEPNLALIHISEPTRTAENAYGGFRLEKKKHTPTTKQPHKPDTHHTTQHIHGY